MYPPELVAPMREELTKAGFEELTSPEQVDKAITGQGTTLVVINSVCGCAAANARPAARIAVTNDKKPTRITTVFAGVDGAAVAQARKYMLPYPPSSPSMGLFKDGKLVHFLERHNIEGKPAEMIAENLAEAFNTYC